MPQLSIKRRIMDTLLEKLSELKNDLDILDPAPKEVTWSLDPLQESKQLPSITITDSGPREKERDTYGRTYTFEVIIVAQLRQAKNAAAELEAYVAAIQAKMESNLQIANLAVVMDDAQIELFVNALKTPVVGAAISYTVEYRHKLRNPYETY